jgi:hypothetical protein
LGFHHEHDQKDDERDRRDGGCEADPEQPSNATGSGYLEKRPRPKKPRMANTTRTMMMIQSKLM